MKTCEYKRSRSFFCPLAWDSHNVTASKFIEKATLPFVTKFHVELQGLRDQNLFKWSMSHDKHGRHARRVKTFKNVLLRNSWANGLDT